MTNEELTALCTSLLELEGIRRQTEARVRELREQLLVAMRTANIMTMGTDLGYITRCPAYVQHRIDTKSLQMHKPDWYGIFCKTVAVPESLQVLLIK